MKSMLLKYNKHKMHAMTDLFDGFCNLLIFQTLEEEEWKKQFFFEKRQKWQVLKLEKHKWKLFLQGIWEAHTHVTILSI